jgi:hypothetical protein
MRNLETEAKRRVSVSTIRNDMKIGTKAIKYRVRSVSGRSRRVVPCDPAVPHLLVTILRTVLHDDLVSVMK